MTPGGGVVAFTSDAPDLVANDTNGRADIFIRDMNFGITRRVSVATGGEQANGDSSTPSISSDGTKVAFQSSATNLAHLLGADGKPLDRNGSEPDVFFHDSVAGITTMVDAEGFSHGATAYPEMNPQAITATLGQQALSQDGRYVVFVGTSWAGPFASAPCGGTYAYPNAYRYDVTTSELKQIGRPNSLGCYTDCCTSSPPTATPSISGDGSVVGYINIDRNLELLADGGLGSASVVALGASGPTAAVPRDLWLAKDGRRAVFASSSSTIVADDNNGLSDAFVVEVGSAPRALTIRYGGGIASAFSSDAGSYRPTLSDLGTTAVFTSSASDLVVFDSNNAEDVFARGLRALPPNIVGTIAPEETLGDGSKAQNSTQCSKTKYPINCATGNFWHTFKDLAIAGRGRPIGLSRTYNSLTAGADGPFGFGWTSDYSMALSKNPLTGTVTIAQENGSHVYFSPNGSGGFTSSSRVFATLVQSGDGTFTFTRRKKEIYTFTAEGRLTALRDLNGYTTVVEYDAGGRMSRVLDPAGRSILFAFGPDGRIRTVTDPAGRSLTYTYDGAGNLIRVLDVAGGVTAFTYDAGHRLLTMTDPRGGVVTNVYDARARVTSQTDQLRRATIFAYSASGTTITDPKGNVEVQEYLGGQLIAITKGVGTPAEARWAYTYDQATLGLASKTDPNGNTTSMTYDAAGNRLTLTDPLGRRSSSTWDALDNVTSVTDPDGVTTTMTYDPAGNLLTVSTPLVGSSPPRIKTITNHYDRARPGDVTSRTDPDGFTWIYGYDAAGNQVSATNPVGDRSAYVYNGIGWVTSIVAPKGDVAGTDPGAHTTTFDHNPFGQVTAARDPLWNPGEPAGHSTARYFDANGNQTEVVDGNGRRTTSTYNAANELTAVTRADGTVVATDYWPDGTLHRQVDGAGKPTIYEYDPLGRVTSVTDPLGRRTSYAYDRAGNQVAKTDPGGDCGALRKRGCTTSTYDSADQLKSVTYSDGTTPNITNVDYDPAGRRVRMTDGTGTSNWTWDSLGRLRRSIDGAGKAVGYEYDLRGNTTGLTYPGGRAVARSYDAAGRQTSVRDWLGNTTAFGHDRNSNLTTETFPSSVKDTLTYDRADRLMAITGTTATGNPRTSFTYGRDGADLVTSVASSGVPADDHSYGYTPLNQVKNVDAAAYHYDSADNLTRMIDGTSQAFDAANQLCWTGPSSGSSCATPPAGATTFSYDTRGNRTSARPATGPATQYSYDQANRLQSATVPAPPDPASRYTPLTPARILDTRNGTGGITRPVGPETTSDVQVTDRGGVPATGVTAVALNVTVTEPTAGGYLTVFPSGGEAPLASNLNFTPGKTVPNLVVVKVGAGGKVSMFNKAGNSHVIFDVAGWYSDPTAGNEGRYSALTPARILDTRNGTGGGVRLGPGASLDLQVSGKGGVPAAGAAGAVLNLAATNTTATSYITVSPTGQARPLSSNVNFVAGDTVANRIMAKLGTGGRVTIYNHSGSADIVVDVGGWFTDPSHAVTGGSYTALAPARILDTRNGTGGVNGPVGAGSTVDVQITGRGGVPPSGVSAVVLNVTATEPTGPGHLTIFPAGQAKPLASDLNYATGETRPNLVVVRLGTNGKVSLSTPTATHVIFDVAGWSNADTPTPPSTSAAYTYNGDGLRTAKTVNGHTTPFVWDTSGRLPLLLQEGDISYVYGPGGLPLQRIDSAGQVLYYHHDQLGSTRALTNPSGATVATYTYGPYGKLTGATGSIQQPFGYTGQYTDTETGLLYLRARYSDPTTGQFLTRDPIVARTRSAYAYADGNPINRTDPTGLVSVCGSFSFIEACTGDPPQVGVGVGPGRFGASITAGGSTGLQGGVGTPGGSVTLGSSGGYSYTGVTVCFGICVGWVFKNEIRCGPEQIIESEMAPAPTYENGGGTPSYGGFDSDSRQGGGKPQTDAFGLPQN